MFLHFFILHFHSHNFHFFCKFYFNAFTLISGYFIINVTDAEVQKNKKVISNVRKNKMNTDKILTKNMREYQNAHDCTWK